MNFSSASVVVGANTVAARSALDGYGDTDTFSITASNLAGSAFDDHVTGSAESNGWFLRGGDDDAFGLDGDDFIMGGSGNDYIDGGDGFDTARYLEDGFDSAGAPIQGVNVNLALKTATDGFGDTDTLENIEAISGSNLDDGITGDDLANRLAVAASTRSMVRAATMYCWVALAMTPSPVAPMRTASSSRCWVNPVYPSSAPTPSPTSM